MNGRPTTDGARHVVVETLRDETRLRTLAWMEANRRRVEQASNGRVGYIYVPSTGIDGQTELERQFIAQFTKEALIVDERWNSGGQIPDRFIEMLNRPVLGYWAVRDGADWRWPPTGHFGPEVMLINGWSGSGGDAFPYFFREKGLGPLIGQRTWGGLIGITRRPPPHRRRQRDACRPSGSTAPPASGSPKVSASRQTSPWWTTRPQLARGTDPQLERAIQECLRQLQEHPVAAPHRPAYENRTPR